jgi:hypothetical protein
MIDFAEGLRRLLAGTAPDGSPVASYRTDLQRIGEATDSHYQPCRNGLHLCGTTDDGDQPVTMGNWILSPSDAQAAFSTLLDRLDNIPAFEADFVLDLQIDGDCVGDVLCNRQGLTALLREYEADRR